MKRMTYFVILAGCLLLQSVSASDCEGCKINNVSLPNVAFSNAAGSSDLLLAANWTFEDVNLSYCGCPRIVNSVFGYAADLQGRPTETKVATLEVNFSYNASLKVTKMPILVTDMDKVALDLALLVYRITVENTGNVTITGIKLNDSLSGTYNLEELGPGENATISPMPYYIVTLDDVRCCDITNIVSVTGWDRCCKLVGPINETANFHIDTEELEGILKLYSKELGKIGKNTSEHPNSANLRVFENKLRIQSNRLLSFEDLLHGNFTECNCSKMPSFSIIGAKDEKGFNLSCRNCRL